MVLKLLCKVFGFLKYLRRRRAKKTTRALKKNAFDIFFLTHFFVMAIMGTAVVDHLWCVLPLRRMKYYSIYSCPIMEMSIDLRLYYERGTLLTKPTLYFYFICILSEPINQLCILSGHGFFSLFFKFLPSLMIKSWGVLCGRVT